MLFLINSELLAAPSGEDRPYKCVSRSHFSGRSIQEFPVKDEEKNPKSSLMKCQTLKNYILFWHSLSQSRKTGQVTK